MRKKTGIGTKLGQTKNNFVMNFIKTFLAAILAFVVGSVLVVFLWIFILLGIAGSMEKSVAVHPYLFFSKGV